MKWRRRGLKNRFRLKVKHDNHRDMADIVMFLKGNPNKTQSEIYENFVFSKSKIRKILKHLKDNEIIDEKSVEIGRSKKENNPIYKIVYFAKEN